MKEISNLDALIKIEVCDKIQTSYLKWSEKKKVLFFFNREEGFYDYMDNGPYTSEELISGKYLDCKFIISDKKAYYRPYVKLIFSNREANKVIQFDTYEEAKKWSEKLCQKSMSNILIFENNIEKKCLD